MKITSRVRRLEAKQPPASWRPCRLCRGSDLDLPVVVITSNDNPLPECPLCGRPIDPLGNALSGPYKRIILEGFEEGDI